IRAAIEKAIALMPSFAPAHQLLGFFEMVEGDDPAAARRRLQRAIQLEPDNPAHVFTLAQAQLHNDELAAARKTLETLLRPNIEPKLRRTANEMLKKMDEKKRTL